MEIIKPSVEIITEPDLFKRIELAARTCYKSEGKIAPGSDLKLFQRLVKSGHESTLEHSNIVVRLNECAECDLLALLIEYEGDTGIPAYIRWYTQTPYLVSGNLRAWRSLAKEFRESLLIRYLFAGHLAFDDLKLSAVDDSTVAEYMPTGIVPADEAYGDRHNIVTARFTCDRGVSHEAVRHRLLSYSQESTRYVNYKDGAQFVEPWWWEDFPDDQFWLKDSCACADFGYKVAMEHSKNPSPQKARAVLTNALKTEVVVTGTVEYWKKLVLPLRISKAAHPDICRIMTMFAEKMRWTEFTKEKEHE